MKDKLKEHLNGVFANAPESEKNAELKEEIYANLCDKYDDLIAEGRTEEEAFRLAISTIGDIYSIIGFKGLPDAKRDDESRSSGESAADAENTGNTETPKSRGYRPSADEAKAIIKCNTRRSVMAAIAIAFYIMTAAWAVLFNGLEELIPTIEGIAVSSPLFTLAKTFLILISVAVATSLLIISSSTIPSDVKKLLREPLDLSDDVLDKKELKRKDRLILFANVLRIVATVLYACCPIPVVVLSTFVPVLVKFGVFALLFMVALATALMIYSGNSVNIFKTASSGDRKEKHEERRDEKRSGHHSPACHAVKSIVSIIMITSYLLISFTTHAWKITWLIFPIMACLDLAIEGIFVLCGGNEK